MKTRGFAIEAPLFCAGFVQQVRTAILARLQKGPMLPRRYQPYESVRCGVAETVAGAETAELRSGVSTVGGSPAGRPSRGVLAHSRAKRSALSKAQQTD